MRRRVLATALVAGIGMATAAATSATAKPLVMVQQDGFVRTVERWGDWMAWTRCTSNTGPTEVWARSFKTKQMVQVPGLTGAGCETELQLHGVIGDEVIVTRPGPDGLQRLSAVKIGDGKERVFEQETKDGETLTLNAVDTYGPLVVWSRDRTTDRDRVAELVTLDLRTANAKPKIEWGTSSSNGKLRIDGVWQSGDGNILFRQITAGPPPTYQKGSEPALHSQLILRRKNGSTYTVSSVKGPIRIADAAIDRTNVMYSLIRTDSNSSWVYHRDLKRSSRRLLSAKAHTVRPTYRIGTSYPTVGVYGGKGAWHMRQRFPNRTYIDRMWGEDLTFGRRSNLDARPDTVQQRIYQGMPSVWSHFAQWPVIQHDGPSGWAGGYTGLSGRSATSQIVISSIR